MKRFEVTYKVLNLLFGQNVFTEVVEANTEKEAIFNIEHDTVCFNKVLEVKEIK